MAYLGEPPMFSPTVPMSLWEAVAETFSKEFADSYLWGASLLNGKLTPHTTMAWSRLNDQGAFRAIMKALKYDLEKPDRFPGVPARDSIKVAYPEYFSDDKPRRGHRRGVEQW
jgi:hypothetical protein